MRVLIDGDGCPVVDLTIEIAGQFGAEVILFCDTSHVFQRSGCKTVTVSKGADSVDLALVNQAKTGDIVVTQDYGLAAMCLAKKALPLRQDGMVYREDNIDALLLARHTAKKVRMAGGRLKGPSKRTKAEDTAFAASLRKLLVGKEA